MDFLEKMYVVLKFFVLLVVFMEKYVDPSTPYKKMVIADLYSS